MKKKEYLSEKEYQKNKKKIIIISIVILIIGIALGGSIIGMGVVKQNKINNTYSSDNKKELNSELAKEKEKLTINKKLLEDQIKPVEEEIKALERTAFTGFDEAYYERQDKIKELNKSIKEDKEIINAIDGVLGNNSSTCYFNDNSYIEDYCILKDRLDDIDNGFNKKYESSSCIPFYMAGGFIIAFSLLMSGSIYMIAKRREILAFSTQQVMPVAKEGINKMAPTMGKVAKEVTKGRKDGLKDDK